MSFLLLASRRLLALPSLVALLWASPGPHAQVPVLAETDRIVRDAPGEGDLFGEYMSASDSPHGAFAVAAAPGAREGGTADGAAFVLRKGTGGWAIEAQLHPESYWPGDNFGQSTAAYSGTHGDLILVGSPGHDYHPGPPQSSDGRVTAYRFEQGAWVTESIPPSPIPVGPNHRFGYDVALSDGPSGELLAVVGEFAGYAHLYAHDGAAWAWRDRLSPRPDSAYARFGAAVDLLLGPDGPVLAVGAPIANDDDGSGAIVYSAGAVYVFERDAGGAWRETAYLRSPTPVTLGNFGDDVELARAPDGTLYLLAGAYNEGRAHVFAREPGGGWAYDATLGAEVAPGSAFGWSVEAVPAGDGISAVVTAPYETHSGLLRAGTVFAYHRPAGGLWQMRAKLRMSEPAYLGTLTFSAPITAGGDVLGASGKEDVEGVDHAGAVYAFDVSGVVPVASDGPPPAEAERLSAWPNPARERLIVAAPAAGPGGAVLTVYDALGRAVAERRVGPGGGEVALDVSGWAPGVYVIRASGAARRVTVVR